MSTARPAGGFSEPHAPGTRPFQLRRYYSIASLVGIVLVVIALTLFYRHLAFGNLMRHEMRNHAALTRAFARETWPRIAAFVDRSTAIPGHALAAHPEVTRLRALLLARMGASGVAKVKIYNPRGITVFSTDPGQIGEDKSQNAGFLGALRGEITGDITFRDRFDAFEGAVASRNLVYTYVPIFSDGGTEVRAVFEVYSDVTDLVQQLGETQWQIIAGVLVCLSLLYLFLFVIVRRADTIIRAHERARIATEQQITHQAYHDALTGLPNRASFVERLDEAIRRSRRSGRPIGLMFVDLDRFKWVNDRLGHDAGDQLLRIMAERFRACVRESDQLFRMGGDEFTVILGNLGHPDDAAHAARRLVAAASEPVRLFAHSVTAGASVGISVFPTDATEAAQLLKNADAAMYLAKESGRGRFDFYTEALAREAQSRVDVEQALRRALRNREFRVDYQPRFSAAGAMTAVEARLHWQEPGAGVHLPEHVLDGLEKTGLIVPVGEWVLRRACEQLAAWHGLKLAGVRVAVSVSPQQLRHEGFVDAVRAALADAGLAPGALELGLPESVLVEHAGQAMALLHHLKSLGVAIALDGFGSGHSSLRHLRHSPIDVLKLDPAFLQGIAEDPRNGSIVAAMAGLARDLGIAFVAEGVECAAQAEYLRATVGCEMQGRHLAAPLPAPRFAAAYGPPAPDHAAALAPAAPAAAGAGTG